MKPSLVRPLFLLALTLAATGCQTHSGPVRPPSQSPRVPRQAHYDETGRFTGTTNTVRNRQYHYDASGRFIGYSEKRGNRRINYDSSGRWIGHTEEKGAQK